MSRHQRKKNDAEAYGDRDIGNGAPFAVALYRGGCVRMLGRLGRLKSIYCCISSKPQTTGEIAKYLEGKVDERGLFSFASIRPALLPCGKGGLRAAIRRIARPSSAFGRRSTENQKTRICRRKSNNLNEKRKCCPPLPGRPYKQKLDGEDAMGLCPKPHQGGSPTLDPPPADVARHGSPAACRSCLDDAIHRFRAGQRSWPCCAQSAQ